jgi:hypothetical protein
MTTKTAILQAIRHKCLDCSCYQPVEVRECPVTRCALWPYRFGTDPEPCKSRGFAKSAVYTGHSEARAAEGSQVPASASCSPTGLLHASLTESGPDIVGERA